MIPTEREHSECDRSIRIHVVSPLIIAALTGGVAAVTTTLEP
ncbi:hypothetical protein HNR06_001729 [Nocardiopsis arvandica]|uniref:Uncharacterized protein n=1 Tax=Nocardiopsis sinuspersici TaxID=501010 RepID=A0A7Z0BJI9_9ACTN|nr:hypothetical protein [Nocardiopsis sinuspersici]